MSYKQPIRYDIEECRMIIDTDYLSFAVEKLSDFYEVTCIDGQRRRKERKQVDEEQAQVDKKIERQMNIPKAIFNADAFYDIFLCMPNMVDWDNIKRSMDNRHLYSKEINWSYIEKLYKSWHKSSRRKGKKIRGIYDLPCSIQIGEV